MAGLVAEGFSVSHAAILDGTTGAESADIYGVREASVEVDTDSYDNTGDDAVLSSWQWFNFATLTVQSGFIPFDLAAMLSGTTLTTEGAGADEQVSMPLWNQNSLNTPTRPVLIRIPSKITAPGAVSRVLDVVLFKVQFAPLSFDGPSYKDGLVISYSGKAVMSDVDEKGQPLVERSIGRLVSAPASAPPVTP